MLTDAEIAAMRGTLDDSLPSTCVINRMSAGTSDGAGGWISGSVSPAGTVACRVSPSMLRPNEPVVAGQSGMESNWIITFPAETDIESTDRIVSDGVTYEIVAPLAPRSWELSTRVIAMVSE
jgi:hypothetical protein